MAGRMGWSPRDLADASMWQLLAAFDGWKRANCAEPADGMTDSEWARAEAHLDELPATIH